MYNFFKKCSEIMLMTNKMKNKSSWMYTCLSWGLSLSIIKDSPLLVLNIPAYCWVCQTATYPSPSAELFLQLIIQVTSRSGESHSDFLVISCSLNEGGLAVCYLLQCLLLPQKYCWALSLRFSLVKQTQCMGNIYLCLQCCPDETRDKD